MSAHNALVIGVMMQVKNMDLPRLRNRLIDPVKSQVSGLDQQRKTTDSLTAFNDPLFFQEAGNSADITCIGSDAPRNLVRGKGLFCPGDQNQRMDSRGKPRVHYFVLS